MSDTQDRSADIMRVIDAARCGERIETLEIDLATHAVDKLIAEVADLRRMLAAYGGHAIVCPMSMHRYWQHALGEPCTCGWQELRDKLALDKECV